MMSWRRGGGYLPEERSSILPTDDGIVRSKVVENPVRPRLRIANEVGH